VARDIAKNADKNGEGCNLRQALRSFKEFQRMTAKLAA